MRAPVYRQSVDRRPLPAARVSERTNPDAFGAGIAQAQMRTGAAVSKLGDVFARIGERMQEERDANMVLEASAEWQKQINAFQNDPEKGLYTRRGKDAVGAYKETETFLDESANSLLENMENDRQRTAFRKYTLQRSMATLESVSRFEAEQHRVWKGATAKALVQTSIDSAAANFRDGGLIQASLDEGLRALESSMAGMGSEATEAAKVEFRTSLHTAVLDRYLVDDPKGAARYYELVKDQIGGAARDGIEKAVKNATMVEWVQETADDLSRKFSSEVSALKYVRENFSGEQENSLVTAMKTRFSEKKAAEAEHRAAAAEALDNLFYNAPDETTLVREMQRRGYSEGKIRAYRRQYRRNRTEDMYDEATSLPWEVGAQELRNIAEKYGASPAEAERLVATHESIREAQLGRIADASETIEDLGRMLDSIGVSPSERKKAMGYYVAANEPELKRQAELQSSIASNSVWDEIQAGQYDAGKMGVEGRGALIERLGELPLTKQQSDALLKAHERRFSVSKHPYDDMINSVIKAEEKMIKNPGRAAGFRERATEMVARMPEGTPLPEIVEAVGKLRKEEVLIERRPGIWPNVRAPAYEAPPPWEGWVFSEKLGCHVRPSGKKDDQGRDILEKWIRE